ncbi:hypothetical protein [Pararhodobacter sp.]|uniref:hypothetical protein n=1 Tax=Pararhodobacter sp. TaxID=2127056 RepID=UPI002AFDF295|nr:hypothetical protein [Pararhodobacter sp.]
MAMAMAKIVDMISFSANTEVPTSQRLSTSNTMTIAPRSAAEIERIEITPVTFLTQPNR